MYIHEAASIAVKRGLHIKRTIKGEVWECLEIAPTDTSECCITYVNLNGDQDRCPRWQPKAADLIADDWEVVLTH